MGDVLKEIGLTRCSKFFRDGQFLTALAAGIFFWLGLHFLAPGQRNIAWTFSAALSLCLLQPAVEELLFRGVIQSELLRQVWGKQLRLGLSTANWLTSLAFAALHFYGHPPLWAASVLLPSLLFGYFRERQQSLYPPLALHIYYNTGYFLTTGFPT